MAARSTYAGVQISSTGAIGPYIADFYCPELGLVVELDGSQHQTREMCEYDAVRALDLARRGIQILRVPNDIFIRDSLLVGEMLRAAVRDCCARREGLRRM